MAIAVIATPASAAQDVADRLVAAGVRSILNFAPTVLVVPPHVSLRKVDLSIELQILSFYQQRRMGPVPAGLGPTPAPSPSLLDRDGRRGEPAQGERLAGEADDRQATSA